MRACSFQPLGDGGPRVEMEFVGKAHLCALGLLGLGYQNICMAGKPKASSRGRLALWGGARDGTPESWRVWGELRGGEWGGDGAG